MTPLAYQKKQGDLEVVEDVVHMTGASPVTTIRA